MAQLGVPLFQRSAERYTSHAQTPFDHATDFTVLARSGRVGLVGFPLGRSYYQQGYWVYREALRRTPSHPEFHEDPAPLVDVAVRLNLPLPVASARALLGGQQLRVRTRDGGVELSLPRVTTSEVACLELA
jgi:hypothetical protein